MYSRRAALLGMVAGIAGSAILPRGSQALSIEEMSPETAAAYAIACRPGADNHAGLVNAARSDLLARIARGLLPADAKTTVGCPICGCSFVVSADGTL